LFQVQAPEVLELEAKGPVIAAEGDLSNSTTILSETTIQFGKYHGQTFKWILSNDIGWAVYFIIAAEKEASSVSGSFSSEEALWREANRGAFLSYSRQFTEVVKLIDQRMLQNAAEKKSSETGQYNIMTISTVL